jgi:hypothetical protein
MVITSQNRYARGLAQGTLEAEDDYFRGKLIQLLGDNQEPKNSVWETFMPGLGPLQDFVAFSVEANQGRVADWSGMDDEQDSKVWDELSFLISVNQYLGQLLTWFLKYVLRKDSLLEPGLETRDVIQAASVHANTVTNLLQRLRRKLGAFRRGQLHPRAGLSLIGQIYIVMTALRTSETIRGFADVSPVLGHMCPAST